MPPQSPTEQDLRAELAEIRSRLEEAEETLRAIRAGEVDALVVEGDAGPQLFTLQGLDAEQNRFRGEMLAQVSDAVIAVDLEERVTFLNAAAERQYRVRAVDVLGRKIGEIYTRQWPSPEAEAEASTALREHGEWRTELIHRTHDGCELHVETTTIALCGPDGVAIGIVATIRDISERKRHEEALRASEARLRGILRQSPAGIIQTDATGRMTLVNERWCEMLGYSEAELLEKSVLDVTHSSSVEATREAVGRLAAGGPDFQIEKNYCRKDGSIFSAQSDVSGLRSPTGEFLGLIAVVVDISERLRAEDALRESEHFLQRITEIMPGVIRVFDLEKQRSLFVSRAVASIIGYSSEDISAMGSEVIPTLMHPDDQPRFVQHMERVRTLRDDESVEFEHRVRAKSGEWALVSKSRRRLRPRRGGKGSPNRGCRLRRDCSYAD